MTTPTLAPSSLEPNVSPLSFQGVVAKLNDFWASQGCVVMASLDQAVGAGTFHTHTTLSVLTENPWSVAYIQPCRRPTDGRYGENPNRLQHYYQYQVIMKPSPDQMQELYLKSLEALGLDLSKHDIRFLEDDWESPTLGAWGRGWEVWLDGMEVTQFTYFQQVGGIDCSPVAVELTYGLERLVMYLQNIDNVYDLHWNEAPEGREVTLYGDLFWESERQFSTYNYEKSNALILKRHFNEAEEEGLSLLNDSLPLVAYQKGLEMNHLFNLLDARGAISVTERRQYVLRIRELSCRCAELWVKIRKEHQTGGARPWSQILSFGSSSPK